MDKKKTEYLSLEKQNKKKHLSLETWYLMGESIYKEQVYDNKNKETSNM